MLGSAQIDAPSAVKLKMGSQVEIDTPLTYSAMDDEDSVQGPESLGRPETAMTARQKFEIFRRHMYAPMTFVSATFDAALSQVTGDHRAFGGGAEGYGKQLGAAIADDESSVFLGKFLFPALARQDPRYFRLQSGPVMHRALYAVSRTFITRDDAGDTTINSSHILARFAAKAWSNIYYPINERGVGRTFRRTASSLLNDSAMNLFREFWPDLRARLLPHRTRMIAP